MRKTLIFVLLASLALCMFVGCNAEPEAANYDIKATVTGMTVDASYNGTYYIKIANTEIAPKGAQGSELYNTYTDSTCTNRANGVTFYIVEDKACLAGAVSFAQATITGWDSSKPYEIKAGTYTGTLSRTGASMTVKVLKDVTLAVEDN